MISKSKFQSSSNVCPLLAAITKAPSLHIWVDFSSEFSVRFYLSSQNKKKRIMSSLGESDQFDRLPDGVVRLVFNKLSDAKSLLRCTLVCKRFASIVPQVDTVSLSVPRKNQSNQIMKSNCDVDGNRGSKSVLKTLMRNVITKPLHFLFRVISLKTASSSSSEDHECCYHSPHQILNIFKEIQFLKIELPASGGDVESKGGGSLLKWRAEFRSDLQSCVILGAKSFLTSSQNPSNREENGEQERRRRRRQQSDEDCLLTGEELKLRVFWTISCLIAASERHYLMREIVSEHRMLRSLSVTDEAKQGRLCMGQEQIEELRREADSSSPPPASERTPVPAMRMKLWYAPVLELPESGSLMEGATLVVITPVKGSKKTERDRDLVARVFNGEQEEEEENDDDEEKALGEAVRKLMKKRRSYSLEINAF